MANEVLGLYIRKMRLTRGFSQQLAANKAGVSLRHWAALEKGRNVTVDVLDNVMQALDLTVAPIGAGATVSRLHASLDANAVLAAVQSIAEQLETLRDIAVESAMPLSERTFRDAAAVEAFVAKHSALSDEEARRLETTARRLASGGRSRAAKPQPVKNRGAAATGRRRMG